MKTIAGLRDYLGANMMDGDEGGMITMRGDQLLDEIVELIGSYIFGYDEEDSIEIDIEGS